MEILIRPMKKIDLQSVVLVDSTVVGRVRETYYRTKLEEVFAPGKMSSSLVAEVDGVFVGFLIGQVYEGEYGMPGDAAYIDTIGVAPDYHKLGVGGRLIDQFLSNMKAANVKKVYTLVDFSDVQLIKFFGSQGFQPSKRLSLELELP